MQSKSEVTLQSNTHIIQRITELVDEAIECAWCGFPEGDHAAFGDWCPNTINEGPVEPLFSSDRKFTIPLACQVEIPETGNNAYRCFGDHASICCDSGMHLCAKHERICGVCGYAFSPDHIDRHQDECAGMEPYDEQARRTR